MTSTAAPSLTQAVTPVAAGAHVVGVAWLRDTAAFASTDGAVLLARDGATHRVEAHPDAGILVAAGDGERLLTGGDDGRVAVTGADGSTRTLARMEAFDFNVGATLVVAAGQAEGVYSGEFDVTVQYH
jgi:hypothetical protein